MIKSSERPYTMVNIILVVLLTFVGYVCTDSAGGGIKKQNTHEKETTSDKGQKKTLTPVVLWTGMGDSCNIEWSMGWIQTTIRKEKPGIYIKCIANHHYNSTFRQILSSFLSHMNNVVDEICRVLGEDENLQDGYNAIGFSQGSQFLRALAQRCPKPRMKNLISLGGQHQGVYGLPHCPGSYAFCGLLKRIASFFAYLPGLQDYDVQLQYWHDPTREETYRDYSAFLADINQENYINDTYREGIKNLENLVLVKFTPDSMVEPEESQWFGFYHPGQSETTYTLQESDLYKQDKLGLRALDERGGIKFLKVNGDHLQFSDEWFIQEIIKKFL